MEYFRLDFNLVLIVSDDEGELLAAVRTFVRGVSSTKLNTREAKFMAAK